MVGVVKEIDGQKAIIPMSGGNGNPLGTIIGNYTNVCPAGWLPCDVDFDANQYPALFAMLGTNHTPPRYDHSKMGEFKDITISTNSSSPTIMDYDGFLVINGYSDNSSTAGTLYVNGVGVSNVRSVSSTRLVCNMTAEVKKGDSVFIGGSFQQSGSKIAYYKKPMIIKARSGLDETQQDYVLQSLNESGSYSTEEVATGKKWIDGKPIYRKVVDFGALPNRTTKNVAHNISNIDVIINVKGTAYNPSALLTYLLPHVDPITLGYGIEIWGTKTYVSVQTGIDRTPFSAYAIIEYTKTT